MRVHAEKVFIVIYVQYTCGCAEAEAHLDQRCAREHAQDAKKTRRLAFFSSCEVPLVAVQHYVKNTVGIQTEVSCGHGKENASESESWQHAYMHLGIREVIISGKRKSMHEENSYDMRTHR